MCCNLKEKGGLKERGKKEREGERKKKGGGEGTMQNKIREGSRERMCKKIHGLSICNDNNNNPNKVISE